MQVSSCLNSPTLTKIEIVVGALLLTVALAAAVAATILCAGAPVALLGAASCLGLSALPLSLLAGGLATLGAALVAAGMCLAKTPSQPIQAAPLRHHPVEWNVQGRAYQRMKQIVLNEIRTKMELLDQYDFEFAKEKIRKHWNNTIIIHECDINLPAQFEGNLHVIIHKDKKNWKNQEYNGSGTVFQMLIQNDKIVEVANVFGGARCDHFDCRAIEKMFGLLDGILQ